MLLIDSWEEEKYSFKIDGTEIVAGLYSHNETNIEKSNE